MEGRRYRPRQAAFNIAAGNRGGEKYPGLRLTAVQIRGDQEFLLPERPFYPGAPARDEDHARLFCYAAVSHTLGGAVGIGVNQESPGK
jgi:hypothetical protein